MSNSIINRFSKLSTEEKINSLASQIKIPGFSDLLKNYWDKQNQELFEKFSENTLSNYFLPFSIAPNFTINGRIYHIPMVVEESSVVAAASWAAGFWSKFGGFNAQTISTVKTGQIHFLWKGDKSWLVKQKIELEKSLRISVVPITKNMEQRGGGILNINLLNKCEVMPDYFQVYVEFETVDSMGANFINSVLEEMAEGLKSYFLNQSADIAQLEIIMCILSNYTPDCIVEIKAETEVAAFNNIMPGLNGQQFAQKFNNAVTIANNDVYRAVTHNKGIMNGVDGVVLATGNDFRAIEANVHAFAAQSGKYKSLSEVSISGNTFILKVTLPLTLGTVGGLTSLHPLAKTSLDILGNPTAKELMKIAAAAGIANHFSAIKALVTSGIQKGHMKMHLNNILLQLNAPRELYSEAEIWFKDKTISYSDVREFIQSRQ